MAKLSKNPRDAELEDFVAAHLISRKVFVESGITRRDPKDILELDVVWTDYAKRPDKRFPIEVKSGKWHLGDLFKFYGWTRYLDMPPGQFICRHFPERVSKESVQRLCNKMGIDLIHVENLEDVDTLLNGLNLPDPSVDWLPSLWRFSFRVRRQFRKVINLSIQRNHCIESAKVAKGYEKLINDAVFFESDPRSRVDALFSTHLRHRKLAVTAANEIGGLGVDFENAQECIEFRNALFDGKHLPVQACLYLAHRGRLAVLRAAVDYYLAQERGTLPTKKIKFLDWEIDLEETKLYVGFKSAVDELAKASSFRLFPSFWQVFMFGWGGFILNDRKEEELAGLSTETGVPLDEIPVAFSAYDKLFSNAAPWMASPQNDTRTILKLMPSVFRGVGAYSRLLRYKVKDYEDLGFKDDTARRMIIDNNSGVRLLDGNDDELLQ